ncbi:MAG: hypothetical protein GJT30_03725 [Geobacter sp.]|nr:hypothetical protein [Geobacter sp.]
MDLINSLNRHKSKNGAIFLKQISRIFWVQKVIFHTLDLTNWEPPTLPKMRLNATFVLGDENDISNLTTNPHLHEALNNETAFHKKLQAGHKLLLGKHNDEIVFYLWAVAGKKGLMNKTLDLEVNQVAIEIGFTRKEYRGHGFFIFGVNYLFPILQTEGVTSCLTDIATHNLPMVKTALKIGFKSTDSFYYWIHTPFAEYAIPKGSIANKISNH